MKRGVRKIFSILLITLLILPFTCQAFADESLPENQEETVKSEELQQTPSKEEPLKSGNEAAEAPAVTEPAGAEAPSEAPELPAAPEEDNASASDADAVSDAADKPEPVCTHMEADNAEPAAEPEPAALKATAAPETAGSKSDEAEKVKNITIDGTSLDGSTDSSGTGWTYEKESGRIVLRDYTGSADITSDGTGVDIVSTGYNRIGTLSCDGDINVIGTGVLLIDKVELAEGSSFNLLPLREYYGEDGGSVAVFLRQEDRSYMLVNRTVKGIIDEKVELPEDIGLILPDESILELQALRVKAEIDEDGNKTIIRDLSGYSEMELYGDNCEYYGGHLLTGDLTLNKGATIRNHNIGEAIVASVIVAGNLINEGLISGGTVTVVQKESGSGGLYSGSGTIEDSYITFRTGQTMSINIKDSTLNLEQGEYTIEQLGLKGSSELYYGGNFEIKNINGTSGSSLNIYSFDMVNNLKLTGEINNTAVLIKSGITELEYGLKLLNGGTIANSVTNTTDKENYGGPVFSYSGTRNVSDGTKGPVFLGPDDVLIPDTDSIPVVSFYLHKTVDYNWNITLKENKEEGQAYTILDDYDASSHYNSRIAYGDLIDTYFPEGLGFLGDGQSIIFEVLRCKDRKLSMTILGDDYEHVTDPDGVFLIRVAYLDPWSNQHGGTTITSTRASQTGTGNIGGNSNSIITGTGITRLSSVDPVKPDPIKPDPVKPDPVKPDPIKPDPDPVKPDPVKPDKPEKPAKEYTVAAVTASGDTLELQIDEVDLNEGDKNAGKAPCYNLSAYINGVQVSELSGAVEVAMDYVLPEEFRDKPLYAVFVNADQTSDETLLAVSAAYDKENEKLTFETSQAGEFIITAFEFDGEEFSPDFYDELEKTDEVKQFIKYLKEKKNDAGL